MKILMINKFLYPRGGAETYVIKLGAQLQSMGHMVEYFGMEHDGRTVGNRVGAYTSELDFHGGSKLAKLTYPFRIIYSVQARKKLRQVLEDFCPDVCHLNNFNFQLTPSIILEIRKWERQSGHKCKIIYTAHDYQLVCPNHLCRNPGTNENCEKCLGGHYFNCIRGRCIHGSLSRSVIGTMEAVLWNRLDVYRQIDTIICCSRFMKTKLDTNPVLAGKTIVMHNFVEPVAPKTVQKQDYVLYFGRYFEEKGIRTLVQAARELPGIPFRFAGTGPLEELMEDVPNITNMGFQTGEALEMLIRQARFTVCPSECYENCPFSVLESQMYGTPVLGANIGGIPELIEPGVTGDLFESRDLDSLKEKIQELWNAHKSGSQNSDRSAMAHFVSAREYAEELIGHLRKVD